MSQRAPVLRLQTEKENVTESTSFKVANRENVANRDYQVASKKIWQIYVNVNIANRRINIASRNAKSHLQQRRKMLQIEEVSQVFHAKD